jgi:hypothetical protein
MGARRPLGDRDHSIHAGVDLELLFLDLFGLRLLIRGQEEDFMGLEKEGKAQISLKA